MLDSLYDPNTKVMYDLKVDDRDFPTAPNLYSFCSSPKGLNIPLWPRQFWLTSSLFNEICPVCSTYKTVTDVPKDVAMDEFEHNVTFLRYGVCPKCKRTRRDFYRQGLLNPYSELAGLAGQRIGKSFMAAVMMSYVTHQFLKLQDPAKVYGVLPTTFMGTMVALTFDRAVQQLWMPYKTIIETSPWFVEYVKMLKQKEEKLGEQIFKMNQTSVLFKHRSLAVHPAGPNKKTLRGLTRLFAACDEVDFFDNEESGEENDRMNGPEVLKSMSNSLFTARIGWRDAIKRGQFSTPNAYMFNISSPQSANSPLSSIVLNNPDPKRIFTFHLATWEVHPKVTESDIRREFSDDQAKADRDFGAIPPRSSRPFLDEGSALGMESKFANIVELTPIRGKSASGQLRKAARVTKLARPASLPPSVLSIDAGFSNNSFSLVVGTSTTENNSRIIRFPVLAEIMPEKNSYVLDYSKIASSVLWPLIRDLNIQVVLADRWNSLKVLHDIENEFRIPALQYSLKYQDFQVVKSYIQSGSVRVPKRETEGDVFILAGDYPNCFEGRPVDHFLLQAATVIDTGKTVSKGEKRTDDIWRALALASTFLSNAEWCAKNLRETRVGGYRGAVAYSGGQVLMGGGSFGAVNPNGKRVFVGVSASGISRPF